MKKRKNVIINLKDKVHNRDKFIKDLLQTNDIFIKSMDDMEEEIQYLKKLVKSLNADLIAVREQSFEYANKIKRPNLKEARKNIKHLNKKAL